MSEQSHQIVMQIKQTFRLFMDGVVSKSMRDKGSTYKINWGIPFHELKKIASQYDKNINVAIELWKENIRECKILATLLMPPQEMSEELLDVWMEDELQQEVAEMLAFNLLQHLSFAPKIAFHWMASNSITRQCCAYNTLARLFMRGQIPNERGTDEYLDQVSIALKSDNMALRRAAFSSLQKFALLGDEYKEKINDFSIC